MEEVRFTLLSTTSSPTPDTHGMVERERDRERERKRKKERERERAAHEQHAPFQVLPVTFGRVGPQEGNSSMRSLSFLFFKRSISGEKRGGGESCLHNTSPMPSQAGVGGFGPGSVLHHKLLLSFSPPTSESIEIPQTKHSHFHRSLLSFQSY